MTDIREASEFETVTVYECPECGDTFTSADTDSGTGNRSPCCGKFGSVAGRGLYIEDADIVITGVGPDA